MLHNVQKKKAQEGEISAFPGLSGDAHLHEKQERHFSRPSELLGKAVGSARKTVDFYDHTEKHCVKIYLVEYSSGGNIRRVEVNFNLSLKYRS